MKVGLQKKSQPSDCIRSISFDISALFNWQENQSQSDSAGVNSLVLRTFNERSAANPIFKLFRSPNDQRTFLG